MEQQLTQLSAETGGPVAFRARQVVCLREKAPVLGTDLFVHPQVLDNAYVVVAQGTILDVTRRRPVCPIHDLGDVVILPPLVNAHTHLQLSWLVGRTRWHEGFAPWLRSMLPLLMPATREFLSAERLAALDVASAQLAGVLVGDVGGSLPGALSAVRAAALEHGARVCHFCEWFGFGEDAGTWPPRSAPELNADLLPHCAPAGHALYSTSPDLMRRARKFCQATGRVFTFHLSESPEESELLLTGGGPLADIYAHKVLPENWTAPGISPLALALRLDLLGSGVLAVHGAQLRGEEIGQFAATGASLCLCPRSNDNLGVGRAPVWPLLEAGVPLCLGTDGLTSAQDLDVRKEAFFLRENWDIPMQALWRLATVNGAAALGKRPASLAAGAPANFSLWPSE